MAEINARAKINLTLDILGKRPDGYHEVAMVMQQVELHDTLTLREMPAGAGIRLQCDLPGLPTGGSNLVCRAARLLCDRYKIRQGVLLTLAKRIPVAAGLAGGSTDAAAALALVNAHFGLGLDEAALCEAGAAIGSDVPFCIRGGTALATGRGELVRPLPPLPPCWTVLAKPPVSVSTAWAYGNYRAANVRAHPDNEKIIGCLRRGDLTGVGSLLCNVLETVTMEKHAEIASLKRLMLELGATASLMSGSGPTVFGLAPDEERARHIADRLREKTSAQVILTKTVYRD